MQIEKQEGAISESGIVAEGARDAGEGEVRVEQSTAGFCTKKLAELPAAALLDECALAGCLAVSTRTLRRMTGRGQLPPGMKLGGRRIWMAGKVIEFLTIEADRLMASTRRLSMRRSESGA